MLVKFLSRLGLSLVSGKIKAGTEMILLMFMGQGNQS